MMKELDNEYALAHRLEQRFIVSHNRVAKHFGPVIGVHQAVEYVLPYEE